MISLLRTDGPPPAVDSPYAWLRVAIALVACIVGGVGLWSSVVVLPTIEAEFGVDRGGASFSYTATMIGFAAGGLIMGRAVDRFGIAPPVLVGAAMLACGYILSSFAQTMTQFILCQALLIGLLGSSTFFSPMVADITHWFARRRGIAVAIVASGSYLSGTIWPPIIQYWVETDGWRDAHFNIGVVCFVSLVPLAFFLRRKPMIDQGDAKSDRQAILPGRPASPRTTQVLLVVAGLACCVAMSMPQVHIVAYCGDLGYGPAVGAEMLSLMLLLGVVSRLISGVIADRIGGLATLILGSALQCLALAFYLPFDGLTSLYLVSALFGLSQGGIVPSYALVVRDSFPAREAGTRISLVMMATIIGMALGGWMSGEIYDLTGSYRDAFLNGIAWNLLNMAIAFWLLFSRTRGGTGAAPRTA